MHSWTQSPPREAHGPWANWGKWCLDFFHLVVAAQGHVDNKVRGRKRGSGCHGHASSSRGGRHKQCRLLSLRVVGNLCRAWCRWKRTRILWLPVECVLGSVIRSGIRGACKRYKARCNTATVWTSVLAPVKTQSDHYTHRTL